MTTFSNANRRPQTAIPVPTGRTLPDLASVQAQLDAALAKIAALEQSKQKSLSLKVTAQKRNEDGELVGTVGAISLYGLGRFPITLYASQWKRLLAFGNQIEEFMVDNQDSLATK